MKAKFISAVLSEYTSEIEIYALVYSFNSNTWNRMIFVLFVFAAIHFTICVRTPTKLITPRRTYVPVFYLIPYAIINISTFALLTRQAFVSVIILKMSIYQINAHRAGNGGCGKIIISFFLYCVLYFNIDSFNETRGVFIT